MTAPVSEQRLRDVFLCAADEETDRLFRHCYCRLLDRESGKEAVEETLARAWASLMEGRRATRVGSLHALFCRIANGVIQELRTAALSAEERQSGRTALQRRIDMLASGLPASGLSAEEKRRISATAHSFIGAMPLSSQPQNRVSPPLFFGPWQGGNFLKVVRPFTLVTHTS